MPLFDLQMLADFLSILHEVPGSVFLQTRGAVWYWGAGLRTSEETYGVDLPAPRWSKRTICDASQAGVVAPGVSMAG